MGDNRRPEVVGTGQQTLHALERHASLVWERVRTAVGAGLHLARAGVAQRVVQAVASSQIVLVSGPAGSGKSAIAKDVARVFAADHFVFSFRAEDFAAPHLDDTLARSQVPASAALLGEILAGQRRKVMFVESMERLLEASTRGAFAELLTLVSKDPTWRVVLTCRDDSAELVRSALLTGAASGSVVRVPPLDDAELREVEAANPALTPLFSSATLRELLRNPYVLDQALRVSWSTEEPLPQSERELRRRVWRDLVRAEHHSTAAMPQRREAALVQVALRRARALTRYVACPDLDAEAVSALRRDALLVSSENAAELLAPAHAVLEDWAILQWLDEQHLATDGSARALSAAVGPHPAVRRTYRRWVSELVDRDAAAADRLFRAVIEEVELPPQFRDDTVAAMLQSPSAPALLDRHAKELLAGDKRPLLMLIRLLRVGCVGSAAWLEEGGAVLAAWASVLRFVAKDLAAFKPDELRLLGDLVEDWARGVHAQTPYPDGADAAVAIADWLDISREGCDRDLYKRALRVIAKFPLVDSDRFAEILQEGRDWKSSKNRRLREMVLTGIDGYSAGRDMPDEVIVAAEEYFLAGDGPVRDGGSDAQFDSYMRLGRQFFPPSAHRGPFRALVLHHPQKALAFMVSRFNRYLEWSADRRPVNSTSIVLTFEDGTSKTQWRNKHLWGSYRGVPDSGGLRSSLLMAMEEGLLELAQTDPDELDALLLNVLRESNSAAITAVVASVATAFPRICGETLLVLLSSPTCFQLDRWRRSQERVATRNTSISRCHHSQHVFLEERWTAHARPHRMLDLEHAVFALQSGPMAARVQAALDRHRAKLPAPDRQTRRHRSWRLSLDRMDARDPTPLDSRIDEASASAMKHGWQYVVNTDEPSAECEIEAGEAASQEPATQHDFEGLASTLVACWSRPWSERDSKKESAQEEMLVRFLLQTSLASAIETLQPIFEAVDLHPWSVGRILAGVTSAHHSSPNSSQFWSLWSLFAERVRSAQWFPQIDDSNCPGTYLISCLFPLVGRRGEGPRWRALEGSVTKARDLFDSLPPSQCVLEHYLRLLHFQEEPVLLDAFIRVAAWLRSGPPHLLSKRTRSQEKIISSLEAPLQQYVYGKPLELKKRKDLREAVLFLLDELVETGSLAAFRMRDDFVTPASTS